ncbi:MAG: hypothetical protein ACREJ5_09510 [Geminicoccaceae bacterium]
MSLVAAYLHLVFTMFLIGYVLYWAIMVVSLRRDFAPPETMRLLGIASRSRWPHVLVPWRLRLPLPLMGWGFLAVLVITGLVLMASYRLDLILALKVALVLLFALIQVGLTRRPARALIMVSFALALGIVVLSGLLIRV